MLDAGCPYAYCEDFEAYASGAIKNGELLGPWKVSVTGPPGSFQGVDEVRPKSGKKSLHIIAPASTQGDAMLGQTNASGLVPNNDLYGRLEIYYTEGGAYGGIDGGADAGIFGLPLHVHSFVFTAYGDNGEGGTEGINLQYGEARFGPTPSVAINFSDPIGIHGGTVTGGAWHCLQWQLDGSTPADVANIWLDGTKVASGSATIGWSFPTPWNRFNVGFTHLQTLENPVEIFLDDFALDGSMIPCP